MLYAGCCNCRQIVPLFCSGTFLPHFPMAVAATTFGPECGLCGPLTPVFTCSSCWVTQGLYLPGMTAPQRVPGAGPFVAPVVHAHQGANSHDLGGQLTDVAREFASEFGQQLGQDVSSMLGNWLAGVSSW